MKNFKSFFEARDIKIIDEFVDPTSRRHPAWTALHAYDAHSDYQRYPKDYLVNQSVAQIYEKDEGPEWLEATKKRIVQVTDVTDCMAALAEIRCYGALLEAGFKIRPIPTNNSPSPDFEYDFEGQSGIVEVATKLEHAEQIERAKQISMGKPLEGVGRSTYNIPTGRVDITTSERHPFGAPDHDKEGDTTQTNAISRICAVKGKETQFAENKPSILWIDFCDLGPWPGILTAKDTAPVISGHGGTFTSGPFWYAFYGWKGAPVFEEHGQYMPAITPMAHYGRFHPDTQKKSRYSAAVICLEEATILYENPVAYQPLSNAVRIALTRLPWFDVSHSIANWKSGNVQLSTQLAGSLIETLSTAIPSDD